MNVPIRPRLRRCLLLLGLALPAGAEPPAGEGPDCAEAVAGKVQGHYESVTDLRAAFEQTSRVATLGAGPDAGGLGSDRATGTVVFAKPGRMRWSYEKPEESLVLTDGKDLWTYDPFLKEAQHLPVTEGFLSGAAIQFLLGEGRLLDSFRVTARACGEPRVHLDLVPREPASYERLALEVDPETGRVHATEVADLFGNVTRVAFSDIRLNTDPDDDLFRFDPPDDVRVIEIPAAP